jgi:16S rRNA (guanine527-N7)-methyltransferase
MVESDARKAAFLRQCARELDLKFSVISARIEDSQHIQANTISARALAPLTRLLELSAEMLAPQGRCLFMKGARWQEEIDAAKVNWKFSYEVHQSKTDPQAAVLEVKEIERV